MLLTNLTLALGLIGTSLTGSAIAISNSNQNDLMISQNKSAVLPKKAYLDDNWSLVDWDSLWSDIAVHVKSDNPGIHFTPDDVTDNIAYLKEYLSIDDTFTTKHVGILNSAKETQVISKSISTNQYVLENDSDFEQDFYIPSRNYTLNDSASWEFINLSYRPFTEKLSFMWGDQKVKINLKETRTVMSSKEKSWTYPLQAIKTKPHSKVIFQEQVINHQTTIRGNVLYTLDFNKNLNQGTRFTSHFDDGHGTLGGAYELCQVLDAIRENNNHGSENDMFSPFSDDLLIYKDNQYFYSFPLTWENNVQTLETHIININK